MRKKSIVLTLALLFCFTFANPFNTYADEIETPQLSIQEALEIAYKSNPDIRKSELEVRKAELQRDDIADYVSWIPTGGLIAPGYQQLYNNYQQTEIALKTAKKVRDSEIDRVTQEVVTAYSDAVKNYNIMESTSRQLEYIKEQQKMSSLAKEIGAMAEHDYVKITSGVKSLEQGYKAANAQYDSSIAKMRALLGKGPWWEPELTSRPILGEYERHELSVELSRAVSESVLVLRQQSLLDIEKSKENWVLPNISSDMQNVNLNMAETEYEQSRRDARATVEGLYFTIDALEGQIEAAEVALDTAIKELEIAKVKYDAGMLSRNTLAPGLESLAAAELEAEEKRLDLENLRADLAKTKAMYAYLTGHTVYEDVDWTL